VPRKGLVKTGRCRYRRMATRESSSIRGRVLARLWWSRAPANTRTESRGQAIPWHWRLRSTSQPRRHRIRQPRGPQRLRDQPVSRVQLRPVPRSLRRQGPPLAYAHRRRAPAVLLPPSHLPQRPAPRSPAHGTAVQHLARHGRRPDPCRRQRLGEGPCRRRQREATCRPRPGHSAHRTTGKEETTEGPHPAAVLHRLRHRSPPLDQRAKGLKMDLTGRPDAQRGWTSLQGLNQMAVSHTPLVVHTRRQSRVRSANSSQRWVAGFATCQGDRDWAGR
jgi:hypothetical protein